MNKSSLLLLVLPCLYISYCGWGNKNCNYDTECILKYRSINKDYIEEYESDDNLSAVFNFRIGDVDSVSTIEYEKKDNNENILKERINNWNVCSCMKHAEFCGTLEGLDKDEALNLLNKTSKMYVSSINMCALGDPNELNTFQKRIVKNDGTTCKEFSLDKIPTLVCFEEEFISIKTLDKNFDRLVVFVSSLEKTKFRLERFDFFPPATDFKISRSDLSEIYRNQLLTLNINAHIGTRVSTVVDVNEI